MNIFRRFYNWLFGIKPEPETRLKKVSRTFRQCIYAIASKMRPVQKGYVETKYSSKKGCACRPPIPQTEFHERIDRNWKNTMNSQNKKMTRGAQNIFRIIKDRFSWGNKNLWRRCDKQKPSHIKYGKPHRGHDN